MAAPTAASADLAEKLRTYAEQLAQVEQLLAQDPANEQFKKLRQDLLEVTKLTEDLLKYDHEKKAEVTVDETQDPEQGIDIDPFQVGMRCEGKFNDSWYPAVITAVAGGAYTVVYIGFGNTEVVDSDGIRPLICEDPLDPSHIVVGAELVGRYSGDGKYYDVIVEAVTDFGYRVAFTEYGNSEELPLEYLRVRSTTGVLPDANEGLVREADGTYRIPEHLKVLPSDSEQDRLRKRRRVKGLKQKLKQREADESRDSSKNSWQAFQSKGAKRRVAGSMKGVRKASIFAAPTTVDGRVGVTGSGQDMTEFGGRKKFKVAANGGLP
jgi:survival-of-motor-neuron-related-splicing factor 30